MKSLALATSVQPMYHPNPNPANAPSFDTDAVPKSTRKKEASSKGNKTQLISLVVVTVLLLSTLVLGYQQMLLNQRLQQDAARATAITERLAQQQREAITPADLSVLHQQLAAELAVAEQRVSHLENDAQAVSRVIADAAKSIVFLQGAYGFVEPNSGRPLRYVLGPSGRPLNTPLGPAVSVDGIGPEIELQLSGSAFVATTDGLLLTNRHVAVPWEQNPLTEVLRAKGFTPVMRRFVGYLPGLEEPFAVELVRASDEADIAILRSQQMPAHTPHLELNPVPPQLGDEVIVIGYPTGLRALLARLDEQQRDAFNAEDNIDMWQVGKQLSKDNNINPLATRGIVGQSTTAAIVYDADTAPGGSGGPVLGLDGRVVAVNAAILRDFGGSNLGVPVPPTQQLLTTITAADSQQNLAQSEVATPADLTTPAS